MLKLKKLSPIEKVYYAFYKTKKEEMYFNEIKNITKMSNSSLQNVLKELKLKKRKTKAHTFYKIKNELSYYIKFDEMRLDSLHYTINGPVKRFANNLDNFSIIFFGSASRKEHTKGSDIDLLIIKPTKNLPKNKELDNFLDEVIEKAKKNTVGFTVYPFNIFVTDEESLNSMDDLVIQAVLSGFPIKGHQRYYENINDIKENSFAKLISTFPFE